MSETKAELVVQEDEYRGTFEIKSYFYGEIRIKLYKDSQEILTIEFADLEDLFTREKGFQKDARGLYRITRGECRARFGVSQKVELHAKPLPAVDLHVHQSPQRNLYDQLSDSRKNSLKGIPTIPVPTANYRDLPNGTTNV